MSSIAEIIKNIGIIVGVVAPVLTVLVCLINGMKCLLRSDMLHIYYANRDNAKIKQYELENFIYLYKAYKVLRGNSFVEKIYKEVMTWEVIE